MRTPARPLHTAQPRTECDVKRKVLYEANHINMLRQHRSCRWTKAVIIKYKEVPGRHNPPGHPALSLRP